MTTATLEHANITVQQIEPVLQLLLTALPGWRVRGQGTMAWFGKTIRWLHVGTDAHYLALQEGGEGRPVHWQSHAVGVKHLGLVVDDLDAVVARLLAAGIAMDHPGGSHPHRRSAYYHLGDLVQLELMQYLSDDPALRHDYAYRPAAVAAG
jgi:hypothetical protein